jgi:hypothetical protein
LVALGSGRTGKWEEASLGHAASGNIEMSETGWLWELSVYMEDKRRLKIFFATPSRKMVAKK